MSDRTAAGPRGPVRTLGAAGRGALMLSVCLLGACASNPVPPPVVDLTTAPGASPAAAEPAAAPQLPSAQGLHDGLPPDGHVVQPGDTLYGIAWRYNLDYRALAQQNGIPPPYRIVVGQRLQLGAPPGGVPGPAGQGVIAGVAPAPAPEMVPAEPSSRGFEFVPDSPSGQQETWQDMPPPSPASPGVALSVPGALPPPAPQSGPAPGISQYPPSSLPGPAAPPAGQPIGGVAPLPPPGQTGPLAGPAPVPQDPGFGGAVASLPPPAQPMPSEPPAPAVEPPPPVAPPPAAAPAPKPAAQGGGGWRWPTTGSVQKGFGNGNKGIDFKLEAGQPVVAASGGEVVYAGNGLGGFRHLVIVKHDQRFLSAYSLNRPITVKEGERVESGGTIAGADAGSGGGTLRFEIRRDGQPVDPAGVIDR